MIRLRRALLFLLPLVLALAVSGALFWGTQAADYERHAAILESIARERHLMALTKQGVLAARFNLLRQYDPLTQAAEEARETRRIMGEAMATMAPPGSELANALADLDTAMRAREAWVERFKSENAILKNSLYYLPLAAENVTGKLDADARSSLLIHDVNAIVQATLVMNLVGGEDRASLLQASLKALREKLGDVPDGARTGLTLLLAHADKIHTQSAIVDPLLDDILSNDVELALDSLERAYSARFQRQLQRAARFRVALSAWSVLLIVSVVVTLSKLLGLYGNLERLVKERTAALGRAMDALWGEMALARKIQTALVPSEPQLDGCDVAATMRPADEVGGDYYDVLKIRNVEWVLMGDVSGHGVPAGLVMMMAQTAVRTTLEREPNIAPRLLCSAVNRTLVSNIRRLGENKYMTMVALRRDDASTFSVAGLHQDVFVYRARESRVEEIPIGGMWLGIIEDVEPLIVDHRITLDEGDVLLLFTDGITEAMKKDVMFDNAGLARVLERLGNRSAREIIDGVLEALDGYDLQDDASLVVIRRGPAPPALDAATPADDVFAA